jgi:ribose transport system substrate-binding protein
MRRICLAFAMTALAAGGCAREEATAVVTEPKQLVAVSLPSLDDPYYQAMAKGLVTSSRGAEVEFRTTDSQGDAARQEAQVRDFIAQKVAAIVVCPCDSRAIGSAIQEANRAGIPVFTVLVPCRAPGAQVAAHVGTDHYQGGKLAARVMIRALGTVGGRVAVIENRSAEAFGLRVKGFREAIDCHNRKAKGATITVVAEVPGGGSEDQGRAAAQDLLKAHPDLAGIFAADDPSTRGARAALQQAGIDRVKLVGFDERCDLRRWVRQGQMRFPDAQHPELLAQQVGEVVGRHLMGMKTAPEVLVPPDLVCCNTGEDTDLAP